MSAIKSLLLKGGAWLTKSLGSFGGALATYVINHFVQKFLAAKKRQEEIDEAARQRDEENKRAEERLENAETEQDIVDSGRNHLKR